MNRLAGLGLAIALLFALVPVAAVNGATITDFEHRVLDQINGARVSRGLVPLRTDGRLWDLAGDRATIMASRNVLSHTVAGALGTSLTRRGISRYSYGETIAYTTTRGWAAAADAIVKLWRNSAPHWALLMSSKYNYVGVGAGTSLVEPPGVRVDGPDRVPGSLRGTRLDHGRHPDRQRRRLDVAAAATSSLQTHTAGLRDFTVQLRRGTGSWVTLATNTTATATDHAGTSPTGTAYYLRVRARDRNGNIGAWSAIRRIWVP